MLDQAFDRLFEAITGHAPFPWQEALYRRFIDDREDNIPSIADLPTGLGKTSVIAIWLLALIKRPDKMPRRLVYVVNRRTVVDQTTAEVQRLRENLPILGEMSFGNLAISTLRGQFADNREWREDPARPAVICGTVDMIGSRLLFEGYRIGFRSRPLHAGFLGQDVLLIHDEAHLEPAFQNLIETIQFEQKKERERNGDLPWSGMRVMALSATARKDPGDAPTAFGLTKKDSEHPIVRQRINATKTLHLHCCEDENKLASQIAGLAVKHERAEAAVLIFVRKVDDVANVVKELTGKTTSNVDKDRVETLTGTMRGYERDELVKSNPVFARFLPPSDRTQGVTLAKGAVYLVCTSAGEVGVNLTADHMVCDLSTFDSMAQRFGRVNRFGDRNDTRVDIVHPQALGNTSKKAGLDERREKTLVLLQKLNGDVSPRALSELRAEQRHAAFAPEPTTLPATDILFDAWALTTIKGKVPGRPPVAPYIRGVTKWEPPHTSVAWRKEVEVITDDIITREGKDFPQELLADYPLKPHELLSDRTDRVYEALQALIAEPKGLKAEKWRAALERVRRNAFAKVWVIDDNDTVTVKTFKKLLDDDKKHVLDRLANSTVLLPPFVGGLSAGILNADSDYADDVADRWLDEDDAPRRQRVFSDDLRLADSPESMALIRTIDTNPFADEFGPSEREAKVDIDEIEQGADTGEIASSKHRFWHWYARARDAENATRASKRPIALDHHSRDVANRAQEMVSNLNLPDELKLAVTLAAAWHDLGKRREIWQRSIGNPNPTDWHAKPGKPVDGPRWQPRHLSDYRHELGSLLDVLHSGGEHAARLGELSEEMRDVVLHLIATHHGYARPHFLPKAYDHECHSTQQNERANYEVMRRYARLQRRYGRWGLAYIESLVRAADWAASANPSDIGGRP